MTKLLLAVVFVLSVALAVQAGVKSDWRQTGGWQVVTMPPLPLPKIKCLAVKGSIDRFRMTCEYGGLEFEVEIQ